jgi:hypothetical protein
MSQRILIAILCLFSCQGWAQEKKQHIGNILDLGLTGINKVICMENGNTLLFHFEIGKPIVIKTFDSLHKPTGTKEHLCSILDVAMLRTTLFKGLFEVNGEAVLFAEQRHTNRSNLVRLRFDGNSGKMIEEKMIGESQSLAKPTRFYVMHNSQEPGYAILFSKDVKQFKQCDVHVTYYTPQHEGVKNITLDVDRKKYDNLEVVGAEWQQKGICVSLALSTLKMNGTTSGIGKDPTLEVNDHFLSVYYIPKDATSARQTTVDVTTDVFPYYSHTTYNPFAGSINVMLLSYREMIYKYGLDYQPTALTGNLLLKMNENTMSTGFNWVNNRAPDTYLKGKTDTGKSYIGLPVKVYTNANGLSTMVSESFTRHGSYESASRALYESYFGNIAVTQFDDDGKELWGVVLPRSQYYKSYRHYYNANDLSKRSQEQELFSDQPDQVYERQFVSQNTLMKDRDLYIIFNDYNTNFHNGLHNPGDTVFTYLHTNPVYYKINRKKEVVKQYLFGEVPPNEYKAAFIEGAAFDEKRGVYATLVQYNKGDHTSVRMAWVTLE